MGVDARIYLSRDVRVDDVAKVVGILAGLEVEMKELGGSNQGSKYGIVNGAEATATNMAGMSQINVTAQGDNTLVDGEKNHFCFYHHECENSRYILLMPRSTPFWLAIGVRLARFFGGKVDFQDCDSSDSDRRFKRVRKNNPEDNKPWQDFQDAIANIKPITKKDLELYRKHAAYNLKGNWA